MRSGISSDFYRNLPVLERFGDLADSARYRPLPDGWYVGAADISGSTAHIEAGRYRMVNMVGAAVISAQINTAASPSFPYVFGGDGASFAFPPEHLEKARDALARVLRWAFSEFGFEMRGAIVPVTDIREAGFEVSVARYRPSANIDYAMFEGGGLAWVDEQMKAGRYAVPMALKDQFPDLAGLSCRWLPMGARNGAILSLLIIPRPQADDASVAAVMHRVINATRHLDRGGHPVPEDGPGFTWPPEGLGLEASASRGKTSLFRRKIQLLLETLLAWIFFKTQWRAGEFDPAHYMRTTVQNADFRKFDDGLKMTLDCDPPTRRKVEDILKEAAAAGLVTYGLFEQNEAVMTCIVPSATADNHVHFIDGAAGGYTTASIAAKNMADLADMSVLPSRDV